jgi:double-strand break repair protein MRE11
LITNFRHVGLLTIRGKDFEMEKLPLKTVRPFKFDTVILAEHPALSPDLPEAVVSFLKDEVIDHMKSRIIFMAFRCLG